MYFYSIQMICFWFEGQMKRNGFAMEADWSLLATPSQQNTVKNTVNKWYLWSRWYGTFEFGVSHPTPKCMCIKKGMLRKTLLMIQINPRWSAAYCFKVIYAQICKFVKLEMFLFAFTLFIGVKWNIFTRFLFKVSQFFFYCFLVKHYL